MCPFLHINSSISKRRGRGAKPQRMTFDMEQILGSQLQVVHAALMPSRDRPPRKSKGREVLLRSPSEGARFPKSR